MSDRIGKIKVVSQTKEVKKLNRFDFDIFGKAIQKWSAVVCKNFEINTNSMLYDVKFYHVRAMYVYL